ncbi:MAG: uracil phosphoribosyltransferase [bacterium]|nr:uracil phosphoribosyltransferase [bacterium]
MPTVDEFVPPEFPDREITLTLVHVLVRKRGRRRRQRSAEASRLSPRVLTEQLDQLRARIAADMRRAAMERTTAFSPLSDDDLRALEHRLSVDYLARGRLVHLEEGDLEGERGARGIVPDTLDILRVNLAVGRTMVSCEQFRDVGRQLISRMLVLAEPHLEHWFNPPETVSEDRVAVLPWRAALLFGEVLRTSGMRDFWHLGACRNEQTLATEVYYEATPPPETRAYVHLVCDPMLATGGTTMTAIERLRQSGVPMERIVVLAVVAAPEGVDLLLHTYPNIRIVTCALDERLDRNGYITGPGLGDFGDLAFGDIDAEYADERWVKPELLTREQAAIILERMQRRG